ncbi:MAG: NAD+ synthase [Phycisphaerales bacterium]|nr:NAD+ synthase [Phycisphaerales bacterium]
MRIAVPRFDPTIGDVEGNAGLILQAAESAAAQGAHLLLLPELAICGYPPRDLLLRSGFVDDCERALDRLAQRLPPDLLVLIGSPVRETPSTVLNALVAIRDGVRVGMAGKRLMPNYDVFDEDRWFTPANSATVLEHCGIRMGLLVCEDLWQGGDAMVEGRWPCDPVGDVVEKGCEVIFAASASPWVQGKHARQVDRVSAVARETGCEVISVNQAGANDDLVFGGEVIHADTAGVIRVGRHPFFRDDQICMIQLGGGDAGEGDHRSEDITTCLALIDAIRGYVQKTGTPGVLIGLSGGIDSAITATMAVAALGPSQVRGVAMPSKFSSQQSLDDAASLCEALGMSPPDQISIGAGHEAVRQTLEKAGHGTCDGEIVDQNLQARLRGQILMALSNASGWLVFPTGNKSELSVGYATLYGDMCGALAVLGDVLKTQVQSMALAINADPHAIGLQRSPVPLGTIERPPSAELAPDQCDQDSLPPYPVLDAIIKGVVEQDLSVEETAAAAGVPTDVVSEWIQVIDRNEHKRWQAAMIPKVSRRAFGRGRRWPLVSRSAGSG